MSFIGVTVKKNIFLGGTPWCLVDVCRQHGVTYPLTTVPMLCEEAVCPPVPSHPHVKNHNFS